MTTSSSRGPAAKRAILVVTSQVVRGGISGRGLLFALETLGHPVWFLPTILLPWHPGQGPGTQITPDMNAFSALVEDLKSSDKLAEIGGVITGYLGDPAQAEVLVDLVKAVKKASPDAIYVCDPVMGDTMGDRGQLYVPEVTAKAIREHLLPLADIATPNCFELGWLTGREITSELQALSAARSLGAERVLVTSSPAMRRNSISNLLVTRGAAIAAEHAAIPNPPNGTGDLMSGLFLAWTLAGANEETALVRAAASTFELVARSVKKGADELLFAEEQASISKPMALVSSRRVLEVLKRG